MTDARRVLVLDDDELLLSVIGERLRREGYEVTETESLAEAREAVVEARPDAALLDIKLPDGEGTELMEELVDEEVPCIMMTAHATIESAVAALKEGAKDYLEKPFSMDRLISTVRSALEVSRLRREVRALREERRISGVEFVAASEAMEEVLDLVSRVAEAEHTTVLLQGDTGTGKGVLARTVHELSPRADGPFLTVTCSALAETIMESELFGHEKGAFTDARAMKRGLVELAEGGTLFLDEVGELSTRIQGKLLQFIEERVFRRVGGTTDLHVDARIVAATNRDLEAEVEAGNFREDLYYRLRVVPIRIPPLRSRPEDIPALARHFVETYNAELGKDVREIAPETMDLLKGHSWPGNVRELRNVIERGVLLSRGETLEADALPPELRGEEVADPLRKISLGAEGLDMEELEKALLERALERTEGNKTAAGELLGLSRHQVRNRLNKYDLE